MTNKRCSVTQQFNGLQRFNASADFVPSSACLLAVRIQIASFLQLLWERKSCGVKILLWRQVRPQKNQGCGSSSLNADPDPAPFQSDGNLRPLVYRSSRAPLASLASFVSVHGHPRLFFEPLNHLILNADPDPNSKKNADPDPKPWAEPFSLVI